MRFKVEEIMREQYIINADIYVEGQFRTGVLDTQRARRRMHPAGCEIPADAADINETHNMGSARFI